MRTKFVHVVAVLGLLAVGSPLLYIGPERSHISDAVEILRIASANGDARRYLRVDFDQADRLAGWLRESWKTWSEENCSMVHKGYEQFSELRLLPQIVQLIEEGR